MKCRIYLLLWFLTFGHAAWSQVQFDQVTFDEAVRKASTERKLVFVDAYTTWCGPCRWMDRNVFGRKDVGQIFNAGFVNLKIDAERGDGVPFARKYEIKEYPTYLYFDTLGNLIHRTIGAMEPLEMIKVATKVHLPEGQFVTMVNQLRAGTYSAETLYRIAMIASRSVDRDSARGFGMHYLQQSQDWFDAKSMQVISQLVLDDDDSLFRFMRDHPVEFRQTLGNGKYEDILYWAVYSNIGQKLEFGGQIPDPDSLGFMIEKANAYFRQRLPALSDRLIAGFQLDLFRLTRQWPRYVQAARMWLASGACEPDQLNSIAWVIATNQHSPDGNKVALQLIDKSLERGETADNMFVKSLVYQNRGDRAYARTLAQRSLQLSNMVGKDSTQVIALLKSLED